MTQLADVHIALADQVRDVARDVNVSPFPFSNMDLPRIEVWPAEDYVAYYDESDSDYGPANVRLRLKIDISTGDAETGFLIMTDLLAWEGPSSLRAVVMADRTLGGVVDSAVVLTAEWQTDDDNAAQTAWVPVMVVVQKEVT